MKHQLLRIKPTQMKFKKILLALFLSKKKYCKLESSQGPRAAVAVSTQGNINLIFNIISILLHTVGFMEMVLSVYAILVIIIYLFYGRQEAEETVFIKHLVDKDQRFSFLLFRII